MEIVTNTHSFDQPIETSVKVGIEVDSKGQKKPSVEIRITRKLSVYESAKETTDNDIRVILAQCKDTLAKALLE